MILIAEYKKVTRRNCFNKKYKKFKFIPDKEFVNFTNEK